MLAGGAVLVTGASRGRMPGMPAPDGMMKADDVAQVVVFVVTCPRHHRILEVALRPVTETSWG